MPFMTVVGVLLVILVAGGVLLALSRAGDSAQLSRRERRELEGLRRLVDELKETAWDHRELDPALSTIVIDTIRTHERRARGELDS